MGCAPQVVHPFVKEKQEVVWGKGYPGESWIGQEESLGSLQSKKASVASGWENGNWEWRGSRGPGKMIRLYSSPQE